MRKAARTRALEVSQPETIAEASVLLQYSRDLLALGRTEEQALRWLAECLERSEAGSLVRSQALVETGRIYARQEFALKAVSCFKSAVNCVEAQLALAQLLRTRASGNTDLEQVEQLLRQAISRGDDCSISDERELEALDSAETALALLLCQQKRPEAARFLANLGYKYRLSEDILCYPLPDEKPVAAPSVEAAAYVRCLDNILPPQLFKPLQAAFAPDSRFWSENFYNTPATGYFSYVARVDAADSYRACSQLEAAGAAAPSGAGAADALGVQSAPVPLLDAVISCVFRAACDVFPQVREAKYAEWWAHCRPHSAGHQLHFDSDDEGQGGLRHPICSTVIYLSPPDGVVGGPTLVTDQLVGGSLAKRGWLVYPESNRLGIFDASVLHGVIPGRGPVPVADESARRTTLMVAFWRDIRVRAREGDYPGSSQQLPALSASVTWPQLFQFGEDSAAPGSSQAAAQAAPAPEPCYVPGDKSVRTLASVWDVVDVPENRMLKVMPPVALPSYDQCFQGF